MEEVCERENCKQALRRVKANKGSPGLDGMTVEKLSGYLKEHWPAIRPQSASRRTSDEQRDATPHDEAQAAGKQREECGGSTMGTEISGLQLHESQATEEALGAESGGTVQGASSGTYASDPGDKPRPNGP